MQGLYLPRKKEKYKLYQIINFNNLTKEQFENLPRLSQNIKEFEFLLKINI